MSTELDEQLRRFADALDRDAPAISVDEIFSGATILVDVDVVEWPSRGQVLGVAVTSWDDATVSRRGNGERDDSIGFVSTVAEAPVRRRSGLKVAMAAAAAAVLVVALASIVLTRDEPGPADVPPPTLPAPPPTTPGEPFMGMWLSTDTDGSSQTMEIARSGADDYDVVIRDEAATAACARGASTLTGVGLLATSTSLLVAQPRLTCDDGTTPTIGPPPQAELANFTLDLDTATGELVDTFGVVWQRADSKDETEAALLAPVPALGSATSGGMWPQSTLDEVRTAQELADGGDPDYTWQLDAGLPADFDPRGTVILTRFLEEGLGWEAFAAPPIFGGVYAEAGGNVASLVVRCAPGRMNPLSSLYADAPSEMRQCAPTIDENTYETVWFSLSQLADQGASGIWVVDQWEVLQSKAEPNSGFDLISPDYLGQIQVEQFRPPTDAEVAALLDAFLRARVMVDNAEQYVLREPEGSPFVEDTQVPLLYGTTSGSPYRRFETELVQGPVWPTGWREYRVRLFADDDTVVEQLFHVVRNDLPGGDGHAVLLYGFGSDALETTENGLAVFEQHSEFADTLTFRAPPLIPRGDGMIAIPLTENGQPSESGGRVVIGPDPVPINDVRAGCLSVPIGTALPIADDAAALARSIEADPDFENTSTQPVSIAGIDGLQIDLTFSEPDLCYELWSPSRRRIGAGSRDVPGEEWRMRLYLVDYPEAAWPSEVTWRPRVLTVAVIALANDFDAVLEQAAPIVDSIEFKGG
jgi:hypothetical protein